MRPQASKRGFTLLEALVSIAILAMIAVMISRIFISSSSAVQRGNSDVLLDEAARYVLDNIQTDVCQSLIRTNVPFRVERVSVGDALYFSSTAIRRPTLGNPRDIAPVMIRSMYSTDLASALNRRVVFEYSSNVQNNSNTARKNLAAQSDFYRTKRIRLRSDQYYSEPLKDLEGLTAQAVLTFMEFRINGNPLSNRNGLPQPEDLPRFVDVVIGFASANDMRQAMRIYGSQSQPAAETYLANHERVYSRRVFMPNTGTTGLDFQ